MDLRRPSLSSLSPAYRNTFKFGANRASSSAQPSVTLNGHRTTARSLTIRSLKFDMTAVKASHIMQVKRLHFVPHLGNANYSSFWHYTFKTVTCNESSIMGYHNHKIAHLRLLVQVMVARPKSCPCKHCLIIAQVRQQWKGCLQKGPEQDFWDLR